MSCLSDENQAALVGGSADAEQREERRLRTRAMMDDNRSNGAVVEPCDDLRCPRCQVGYLIDRQCNALCEVCGYVESCEDIFPRSSVLAGPPIP